MWHPLQQRYCSCAVTVSPPIALSDFSQWSYMSVSSSHLQIIYMYMLMNFYPSPLPPLPPLSPSCV